jgi:hypothetical protein
MHVGRLMRGERGSALILAALAMPIIVGSAGLAVDTIQWTLWKRQLQQAADSGAIAGAFSQANSDPVNLGVQRALAMETSLPMTVTAIENPPSTGPYAGKSEAVAVALQTTGDLPFSGFFLSSRPTVLARATAAALRSGQFCILAMESSNTRSGITFTGNATLDLGCGMATNSSADEAISAAGSSFINATTASGVGGVPPSDSYVSTIKLRPFSLKQSDPFAHLPIPTISGRNPSLDVNPNRSKTVSPGTYDRVDIQGNLFMEPGVYYIDGGAFKVGSQATITGTGVTIVLTSSSAATSPSAIAYLDIGAGATINLAAPSTGTYAGVLFHQDRRALDTTNNIIIGNSFSRIEGAIHLPNQQITFTGTSGMNTDCMQMIGRRVSFTGNSKIINRCPSATGSRAFEGTVVRLVS